MRQLIDKVFLYILGIIMMTTMDSFAEPVQILLLAFIWTGLGSYVKNEKIVYVLLCSYVLLCFGDANYIYFLPLIVYESGIRKQRCGYFALFTVFYGVSAYEVWQIILWFLSAALSVYLAEQTLKIQELQEEKIWLRDTSVELNLALKEKNQNLMERQDYEIHLATLQERNRIAREIHDNVGHMLSRSILQIGALTTIYKEEPVHGQLLSVNDTLNTAMNNIRESVLDLHDDAIDLRQAMTEIAKPMQDNYEVKLDYDMSKVVPNPVKYCFLTIVKEAMSNIVKHSDADKITILVREHPAFYQLAIEDNGSKEPKNLEGGIGLGNMQERVKALHGNFHVKYEQGFKINVSVKKEREHEGFSD